MSLAALHTALRAEGEPFAETLAPAPPPEPAEPAPPAVAASGPRAAGRRAAYELLLELILEGSLLHYGRPRLVRVDDPDLALLLGDRLYALGLERLAALGDLAAVAELGELISLLAQAHLRQADDLVAAIWAAGAVAIGWGSDLALRHAQDLARREDVAAMQALLRAADDRRTTEEAEGAADPDAR